MGLDHLPQDVRDLYEVNQWRHACAILKYDFPQEWNDVTTVLKAFRLQERDVRTPGGRKSPISNKLDERFVGLGWAERGFETKAIADDHVVETRTHKVDLFKNRVALEVEWNNKDPFFDRDLDNFRHLFDLNLVSVGIIITRRDELQEIFDTLGKGSSYGASTTHISNLLPRIQRGGGGGCPILVFGISKKLYIPGA
jgi:hypothetical protein